MSPLQQLGKAARPGAGDVIRAMVCGYPASARAMKPMVVLRAFVDDSSSEVGDRRLFLAGFINSAEKWAQFSDAWEKELQNPPSVCYCHMVEAQNLRGEFKGWNEDERDRKILALARVIRAYRPWSVHCSVSRQEYHAIVAPSTVWPFKNPYFVCFIGILTAAAEYHKVVANRDVPLVDFVFDQQDGLQEQALLWHGWLKQNASRHLRKVLGATPTFENDRKVVALQAADMLAWHLRRRHERGNEIRPALDLLLCHHAGKDIDAAALKQMARNQRSIPGVDKIQNKGAWRSVHRTIRTNLDAGAPLPKVSATVILIYRLKAKARDILNYLFKGRY